MGLHGVLNALVEAVPGGTVVEGGVQEGVHFVAEGETAYLGLFCFLFIILDLGVMEGLGMLGSLGIREVWEVARLMVWLPAVE